MKNKVDNMEHKQILLVKNASPLHPSVRWKSILPPSSRSEKNVAPCNGQSVPNIYIAASLIFILIYLQVILEYNSFLLSGVGQL